MLKFVSAEEANTMTKLVTVLFEKDNVVKAIAVTGENTLLESLWSNSKGNVVKMVAVTGENASELCVCKVNYTDDKDILHGKVRMTAVWELFKRWEDVGLNTHHAKFPYDCKGFTKFVDIDKYTSEVTYVVFLENKVK